MMEHDELSKHAEWLKKSGLCVPTEPQSRKITPKDIASMGTERDLMMIEELEEKIDRLQIENDTLKDACRQVSEKYDRLYEGMDHEYAAFFTAMNDVVKVARSASGVTGKH